MVDRRAGAVAEPIRPPAPPKTKFEWRPRVREEVGDAERYTRFVFIMRRALFAAALVLLGAVVVYAMQPRQQQKMTMVFEKMGIVSGDLAMLKPKLNGIDSEGNPFVVTAQSAVQNPKNLHEATLKNVEADMDMKGGQWINLTSPHGRMDSTAKTLVLWGPISVYSDDGHELHTDLANVDLVKGVVVGPHHVYGQGPQGTYVADHFRIERLNDPCNKTKKPDAPTHTAKPKHPGKAPEPICPALPAGTVAQKTKPLIHLIGNVHMVFYPAKRSKGDTK